MRPYFFIIYEYTYWSFGVSWDSRDPLRHSLGSVGFDIAVFEC